jgi:hypothetical protein
VHNRNFGARRLPVKRHAAILGMQMRGSRMGPSFRDGPKDQTSDVQLHIVNLEVLRPRNNKQPPVNPFLTINQAKIAE